MSSRNDIFFGNFHRPLEDPVTEFWRNYQGWAIIPSEKGVKTIRLLKNFGRGKINLFKKVLDENGYRIIREKEDNEDHVFISYTKK